jgi:hypothetical protein
MRWKVGQKGVASWLVLLGLLATGEGTASTAAPATERVNLDGAGLELELGHTPRCVILPRRLQVPQDCAGIDLAGASGEIENGTRPDGQPISATLATILWRPFGHEVVIMAVASMPPVKPTPESVGEILADIYNLFHSPEKQVTGRDDPRLKHDRITVAGAPAIRYSTDTEAGGRALSYVVFGERHAYAFGFFIHTRDDTRMRALAEALVATIRLPKASTRESIGFHVLGSLFAAFLLAGILSQSIRRWLGKTVKAAFVAFVAAGILCTALGWIAAGAELALLYPSTAGFWFLLDILRARGSKDTADLPRAADISLQTQAPS